MTGLEPVLGMLRLAVHTKVGSTVSKEVVIRYSQPHSYRLSPHLRLPISAHNYYSIEYSRLSKLSPVSFLCGLTW
jgi:hypothetical protein